jgi:hypothetical protein
MQTAITEVLGYAESPNYLHAGDLEERPFSGFSHVYRKAREQCGLQGVYLLSDPRARSKSEIPVVFYCKAENEPAASRIHRRVWNQGVVPFVLVETPKTLRLYSGFRFDPRAADGHERGVLAASVAFNEVSERLQAFRAEAIDSGAVWDRWGQEADPRSRVDRSLLAELEKLEMELRKSGLERETAHALIGKFVYLKYLRDRQILSNRKLAKWHLDVDSVFSHRATLKAFREVNTRLDGWLNGSVFSLPDDAIQARHLQLVASVFAGGTSKGQLALNLEIYDFSFIPIETLSVIYEQFLHADEEVKKDEAEEVEEGRASQDERFLGSATEEGKSRGRRTGAYYTPIPLVNYMLGELEAHRPLQEEMCVLDPSCGSGAFLVQCYRALIEKVLTKGPVRPVELRELLTKHVFGVDRDEDACRMAEMSLILTLLDYTTPPDLETSPQFKLPLLRGRNIFCADFFDPDSQWTRKRPHLKVDWLVGNPPWREVERDKKEDRHALEWIQRNAERYPTGGNQVAEAFVWHSLPLLNADAAAALLMPAMTLFKMESTRFRARFFETVYAWSVTNLANLAYVLFSGRSQAPALALFFEPRADTSPGPSTEESILTFAPILTNQRAGRAQRKRQSKERGNVRTDRAKRKYQSKETWSVVVNGAELRELRMATVIDGDFRPWKVAMWGSFRDSKLLRNLAVRFPSSLADVGKALELHIHEGFQLRRGGADTEPMPQLAGLRQIDFSKLKNCGRIFTFPTSAFSTIPEELANVRKGRGELPWLVSTPPHVIVDASRRFAVYNSAEFIAVPSRKIGISVPEPASERARDLLKALALYLSSDFCRYQQFFTTPEWGVRTSLATLDALRDIPVALGELTDAELRDWAALQESMAAETGAGIPPSKESLSEVDARVYQTLGLIPSERILVEDFVRWNMQLVKGKVPSQVVAPPSDPAIDAYLTLLRSELDEFVGRDAGLSHDLNVVRSKTSAMLVVRLLRGTPRSPIVVKAGDVTAVELERTREHLLRRHSQWLYFERSLKIYQDGAMYFFKPLEAIHWTRRQAILDAGEIVAETLGSQDA